MALLAVTGWLVALVFCVLWLRGQRPIVVAQAGTSKPPAAPGPIRTAVAPSRPSFRPFMVPFKPTPAPASAVREKVSGRRVALLDADGRLVSERAFTGATPPAEITRPHGRSRATVYKLVGQDGERFLYRAES